MMNHHLARFPRTQTGSRLLSSAILSLWIAILTFIPLIAAADSPPADAKAAASGTNAPAPAFPWVKGPTTAAMKDRAEIKIPEGYLFTDGDGARRILESAGNLTSGSEVGFVAPASKVWFVVFRFSPEGYVKDDDKDKLDASAMLSTIREGVDQSNEERKKRGFPTMKVLGWQQPPHYDAETHNLEWALLGESEGGEQVVNYNTRLLGRKGVMEVKLVVDPDKLAATLPEFKKLLTGYQFKTGERYAEYRQGDKLATYGLAALVTGGAVAVAAKTGLLTAILIFLKKGAKLVAVAVVGLFAAIKRMIVGRDRSNPPS